ncbi:hypothetical protein Dimus_009973 [Dionaea muscipula]
MILTYKTVSLFVLLTIMATASEVLATHDHNIKFGLSKVTVELVNQLGPNIDLNIHCKSKDDDLHAQKVPYQQMYWFSFHPNILGTTLFFCGFQWQNQAHSFDVYVEAEDNCNEKNICLWYVRPTGPCLVVDSDHLRCFDWKKESRQHNIEAAPVDDARNRGNDSNERPDRNK